MVTICGVDGKPPLSIRTAVGEKIRNARRWPRSSTSRRLIQVGSASLAVVLEVNPVAMMSVVAYNCNHGHNQLDCKFVLVSSASTIGNTVKLQTEVANVTDTKTVAESDSVDVTVGESQTDASSVFFFKHVPIQFVLACCCTIIDCLVLWIW